MNYRNVAVGFGAFFTVGAFVWLPLGAAAKQSLVETGVASQTAGQLATTGAASGVNAGSRSRGVAQRANRARQNDQVWENGGTPARPVPSGSAPTAPGKMASNRVYNAIDLKQVQTEAEMKSVVGKKIGLTGVVEFVLSPGGEHAVVLKPDASFGFSENLRFHLSIKSKPPVEVGERVGAIGAFRGWHVETDRAVILLDEVSFGPTTEFDETPAPPNAEPAASPEADPLQGWSYRGLVKIDGGTAVFVGPNGKPVFVTPGTNLAPGVTVEKLDAEEATLQVNDRRVRVFVW